MATRTKTKAKTPPKAKIIKTINQKVLESESIGEMLEEVIDHYDLHEVKPSDYIKQTFCNYITIMVASLGLKMKK